LSSCLYPRRGAAVLQRYFWLGGASVSGVGAGAKPNSRVRTKARHDTFSCALSPAISQIILPVSHHRWLRAPLFRYCSLHSNRPVFYFCLMKA